MQLLESRLRNVEAELAQRPSPGNLPSHAPNNSIDKTSPGETGTESAPTPLYEGESSFASQSAEAKEIVERFAHPNRGPDASSLSATLDSINSLLGSNLQNKPLLNETSTLSKATFLPLPAEMIVTMLRRFQGMVLSNTLHPVATGRLTFPVQKPLFLTSYPINNPLLVEQLCQRVYFPTRKVSVGDIAAMHGVLYFVLKECICTKDILCEQFDLKAHLKTCKESFEAGLMTVEVLAVPSFENLLALAMGVS